MFFHYLLNSDIEYILGLAEGPMILGDTIEVDCSFFFIFKNRKGVGEAWTPSSASPVIHGVPSLNKKED